MLTDTSHQPNWQTATLPPNTAFFAIGDIHAHHEMLEPLLKNIEQKIAQLPVGTKVHLIGIGDYIDRGASAPKTIELLLNFRKNHPGVETNFLCGNHDLCFKYILDAQRLGTQSLGDLGNPKDTRHHIVMPDGSLPINGFLDWADGNSGGGIETLKNYCPSLKEGFIERCRAQAPGYLEEANAVLAELKANIPQSHKDFFSEVAEHRYLTLGDYLFIHSSVDPNKTLEEQGIKGGKNLTPTEYMDAVSDHSNPFLWREKLGNCPYVVVHGHTPTAIDGKTNKDIAIRYVDPQKPYRLGIDTGVFSPDGALTCMMKTNDTQQFMAVANADPSYVFEYHLSPYAMERAEAIHAAKLPQYHEGGDQYFGEKAKTAAAPGFVDKLNAQRAGAQRSLSA